jgi:hypothetical protein
MNCGRRKAAGSRRLDPNEAAEVMRAAGLEPLEPYPGWNVPWKCRCVNCGNEVEPRFTKIQQGRGGCKPCGYKASAEKLRLDPAFAAAAMEAAGLEPLEPYRRDAIGWA